MKKVIPIRIRTSPRPPRHSRAASWRIRARRRDARPAHLGHRPLQLPLRLLHAARGVRRDYQFLPHDAILSFEEIARLARIFVGLGVEKIRLTGGEPLLRRDLTAWSRCSRELRRRPHAHHQRLAAREAGARAEGGRARPRHREPRLARRRHLPRDERRRLPGRQGARGHRRRRRRGPRADQDQHGGEARRERPATSCAMARHFRGTRPHRALHRVHGRRHAPTAGAWTTSCRRPRSCAASSRALAARAGRRRTTPAKSPSAGATSTARARSASSRRSRRRSAATARARACRPRARSSRASSRSAATTCKCAAARRRERRRRSRNAIAARLAAARRPLLRDPHRRDRARAQGRDVATSADERASYRPSAHATPRSPATFDVEAVRRARRDGADADRRRASAHALRRQARARHADDARRTRPRRWPSATCATSAWSKSLDEIARGAGRLGNRFGRRHHRAAGSTTSTRRRQAHRHHAAAARARCSAT